MHELKSSARLLDYMLAISVNDGPRELSFLWKIGHFFYLTQDDRFIIKMVNKSEVKVIFLFMPFCSYKL